MANKGHACWEGTGKLRKHYSFWKCADSTFLGAPQSWEVSVVIWRRESGRQRVYCAGNSRRKCWPNSSQVQMVLSTLNSKAFVVSFKVYPKEYRDYNNETRWLKMLLPFSSLFCLCSRRPLRHFQVRFLLIVKNRSQPPPMTNKRKNPFPRPASFVRNSAFSSTLPSLVIFKPDTCGDSEWVGKFSPPVLWLNKVWNFTRCRDASTLLPSTIAGLFSTFL